MIVWYEFPETDDTILELLGLSANLFGCSKQLYVDENMFMHHANVIQYKDFWINVRVLKLAPGCEGKSHTWL